MTQRNEMAEKKRLLWDNEEIPGLVSVDEIVVEKNTIEVPSFSKLRTISNGVIRVPIIVATYKLVRDAITLQFFKDFHYLDQVKDGIIIRTDGHGVEFDRELIPSCECIRITDPAYDAANPDYAQFNVSFAPWDFVPIGAL